MKTNTTPMKTTNPKKLALMIASGIVLLIAIGAAFWYFNRPPVLALLTPMNADLGSHQKISLDIAYAQFHAAGGRTVELRVLNSSVNERESGSGDLEKSTELAKQAAKDRNISLLIGPVTSGHGKVLMPILNQGGLVSLSPTMTYPGFTIPDYGEAGEYRKFFPTGIQTYFSIIANDTSQGLTAAKFFAARGHKNVLFIHDNTFYSNGLRQVFEKTAAANGLTIVGEETIGTATTTPEQVATMLADGPATAIFFVSNQHDGFYSLLNNVREQGFTGPILAAELDSSSFDASLVKDLSELYTTMPLPQLDTTQNTDFANYAKEYKKQVGNEPTLYDIAMYETARVALAAIQKGGSDRDTVRKTIANMHDFKTVYGPISFDAYGKRALDSALVEQWENTQWAPIHF